MADNMDEFANAVSAEDHQILGLHAVLAVLEQTPERIDAIWLDANRHDKRVAAIVQAARIAHVRVQKVPRAKLDQLAAGLRHQGAIARARQEPVRREADLSEFLLGLDLKQNPLLLVLDEVQDPHNLGACLRSADAAGVCGLIIPRDQSASVTATVRRVACGATETVPIFQVTNLTRALQQLKDAGIWLVGTSDDADATLFASDLSGPLAFIMGGEEKGLRRLTREQCDFLVKIPMFGQVSSLNVSVATGICLFEAIRQRA